MRAIKKKKRTLQVQTHMPRRNAALKESKKRRAYQASFTIEGAIALSIFIFACTVMMIPMLVFDQHRYISAVLEDQSRTLSKYKYVSYWMEESGAEGLDKELVGSLETGLSSILLASKLKRPGIKRLDVLSDSEVDEEMVRYTVNYETTLPFRVFGLDSVSQQVVSSRRAWIGSDGQRWENGSGDEGDESDPIVYIGITSVRYHTTPLCSYLSHNIYTASGAEIADMRTQSGSRYSPCAACKPNMDMALVYYTDNGRAYHSKADCSSMNTYIQARKLSEVVYMGACSRCGASK